MMGRRPGYQLRLRITILERYDHQFHFALALGIPESMLSRYVRGERPIPPNLKRRMAQLLGVPEARLFTKGWAAEKPDG